LSLAAFRSRGSSVSRVTMLRAERPVLGFRQGPSLSVCATASRPALGPTQPPTQWVPGVRWPESEAGHLSPSSGEVRNAWIYASLPHTPSWSTGTLYYLSLYIFLSLLLSFVPSLFHPSHLYSSFLPIHLTVSRVAGSQPDRHGAWCLDWGAVYRNVSDYTEKRRKSGWTPPPPHTHTHTHTHTIYGFDSRRGLGIFFFTTASRTALGPT
jgi:hypothetical protein